VRVDRHRAIERESPLAVTLLQSLARAERMDWIVQKATELGVAAIVPLRCERSVVRLDTDASPRRREHWRTVAISACEQCGRNRLPCIHDVVDVATACAQADSASLRLLLAPDAPTALVAAVAQAGQAASITLLIGPEGGFSAGEIELAQRGGFQHCHLGPRVLRVETAPLAALASLQALCGDFRA
jgi:16S rRNA (uracil1498-N3)-methyltransferase